jgi:hypothetical protein
MKAVTECLCHISFYQNHNPALSYSWLATIVLTELRRRVNTLSLLFTILAQRNYPRVDILQIILIQSQSFFALIPKWCLVSREAVSINFIVFIVVISYHRVYNWSNSNDLQNTTQKTTDWATRNRLRIRGDLRKCKQFLLHMWHLSSDSCYKHWLWIKMICNMSTRG